MQEGVYAGWGHIDSDLISLHLFGHPKSRPVKAQLLAAMVWHQGHVKTVSAMHSHMGSSHHLASQAECTSAAV